MNPIRLCVAVGLLLARLSTFAETAPPLILELTDTVLIARVWEVAYPDSTPPSGTYQMLLTSGPALLPKGQAAEGEAHLLRNGTEAGHLNRSTWQQVASNTKKERGEGWTSPSSSSARQEVPLVWKAVRFNRKTLLAWTEWPAGLTIGLGTSVSAMPSGKPQSQRDIEFGWSQKLYRHYLLAAEIHRAQFGGGLTSTGSAAFWGDAYWGWSMSTGLPGLKYTLALANQPLPEYFWLDSRAATAIQSHQVGRVVKQWTGPSLEMAGNLSHTLDARLGYLRYGFHFDTDAYRMPIQTVALDELPALFGTWGTGLVMASNLLATHFWLDIPDLALTLPHPMAYPSHFRIAFLHLDLAYRSVRNFNLGASVRIHIDNPIMNLPGA